MGLSRWLSGKESACQCRRRMRGGFDPWAGKISWRRNWQCTPVFLPGKFHGQRSLASFSPWGCKESKKTKGLNNTKTNLRQALAKGEGSPGPTNLMQPLFKKKKKIPAYVHLIKPVNPKGNQPWIFIGRTDAKPEAPVLWLPDVKSRLLGKDPDAGKDWRQEEKGTTEDKMVEWHHQLNGHEFEQALGYGEGQGSLVCYSPWGCKELDMTERLNSKCNVRKKKGIF